jgi:hypothetical protein
MTRARWHWAYVAWNVAILVVALWFLHSVYVGEWLWGSGTTLLIVIASRLAVGGLAKQEPPGRQHDRALFDEFMRTLPMEPTMLTIRDHSFGDAVRTDWIRPIYDFVGGWSGPDREFVDPGLEAKRKALYERFGAFSLAVGKHMVTDGEKGEFMTVFPREQRGGPRPDHVRKAAQELDELARPLYRDYEEFVRECRRKLAQ